MPHARLPDLDWPNQSHLNSQALKLTQKCAHQGLQRTDNIHIIITIITFSVEELSGVLSTHSYVAGDGPQQFDDVGQVVLISAVVVTRVGLKQVVSSGQLKGLKFTEW